MSSGKSQFTDLVWSSIVVVLFTAAATIFIVAWLPILPEAMAVDMNRANSNDFDSYIALHQTESWHYTAMLHEPVAIAYCAR
jgi:hypothetical protein